MAENTASAKADKKIGGSQQSGESSFDMDELRELMELVTEQGFTEFEFENENIRVRLSKAAPHTPFQNAVQATAGTHVRLAGCPACTARRFLHAARPKPLLLQLLEPKWTSSIWTTSKKVK